MTLIFFHLTASCKDSIQTISSDIYRGGGQILKPHTSLIRYMLLISLRNRQLKNKENIKKIEKLIYSFTFIKIHRQNKKRKYQIIDSYRLHFLSTLKQKS